MKKLLSLLMCVMLCMMTLAPAMAENIAVETPAVFSFKLDDYKAFYDILCQQMLDGQSATWTVADDGKSVVASAEGLCDLTLYLNEEGAVQYMRVVATAGLTNLTEVATSYGVTVALGGMTALYNIDQDIMAKFEEEFNPLLESLMSDSEAMMSGETLRVDGTVAGMPTVLTVRFDLTSMSLILGFLYAPAGTVIAQ